MENTQICLKNKINGLKEVLTIKKILLQIAIDEEKRKKALIFIVLVVTGLLMLIAFFLYLITNHLDIFKEFIFGDETLLIKNYNTIFSNRDNNIEI